MWYRKETTVVFGCPDHRSTFVIADDDPAEGAEHVDQGGGEDALLEVGDAPAEAAGLPPLGAILAAGGNGQDEPAGSARTLWSRSRSCRDGPVAAVAGE